MPGERLPDLTRWGASVDYFAAWAGEQLRLLRELRGLAVEARLERDVLLLLMNHGIQGVCTQLTYRQDKQFSVLYELCDPMSTTGNDVDALL